MTTDTTFELLLCIPPNEYDIRLADFAEDMGLKVQSALSYAQKAIRLGFDLKITGSGLDKRVHAPAVGYDKIRVHAERYWEESRGR